MQDQYDLRSHMVVKRQPKKLPSVRGHILRALGIIIIAVSAAALLVTAFNDPDDAVADGAVVLDPAPLPPIDDTLDSAAQTLPDLLDGIVPQDENPTELLDALGNKIGVPINATNEGLAGTQKPESAVKPRITGTGPRTILIDGQPLDGSSLRSPLSPAPILGFSRLSPFGPIPKPNENGQKPVSVYARPFTAVQGKNTVSIIIGGLGIDADLTRKAIDNLPPEVSLSFAAHTDRLQQWVDQARAGGHEVLIELPLESGDFNPSEPGAQYALKTDVTASRNIRNLDYLLSRAQGYFSVTNYNGDRLVKRADVLAPILTHIADAGIGFVFDGSSQAHTLPALATSVSLPYKQAYTLIDTVPQSSAIETELLRLEAQATAGLTPIGVGFAYAETFDQLLIWTQTLETKNLQLAPASYALLR